MDRTVVIVKPHAVGRFITGEILARFEKAGLEIFELKTIRGNNQLWEKFYPSDDSWYENVGAKTAEDCERRGIDIKSKLGTSSRIEIGKMVKQWLVEHMSSGMCVAGILRGNEAALKARLISGKTLPNLADPGTIRFDYSSDSPTIANEEKRPIYNIIHASDPEEVRDGVSAIDYEIGILFPERN